MKTSNVLLRPVVGASLAQAWGEHLDSAMLKFGISDTDNEAILKQRVCMFLANVCKETDKLTKLEEDLWYRAERIVVVWPSLFKTVEQAKPYEKNAQKLANYVYGQPGNQLGNTQPNDGYYFRGRGPVHTTGRYNYKVASKKLEMDFMTHPELIAQPEYGSQAAALFWKEKNINRFADTGNVKLVENAISPGKLGLNVVMIYYKTFCRIFDTN